MARLVHVKTKSHHVLGDGEFVIGRHPSCDVQVLEKQVSRKHCTITREKDGWVLADAGSVLGTFLNGELLARPQVLETGDEIRVGTETYVFEDNRRVAHKATLRPISEAAPGELVPFDVSGALPGRHRPVVIGLAIAALAVGGLAAVLLLTRREPSHAVMRAARLLAARDAAGLWEMLTDDRRRAMAYDEFYDQVKAVPDSALDALRTLEVGSPLRTDQGVAVPVYIQLENRQLADHVVLFRQGGQWRIHSAPIAWLNEFKP